MPFPTWTKRKAPPMGKTCPVWVDGIACPSISDAEDRLGLAHAELSYRVAEVKKTGCTWFRHEGHVISLVAPPAKAPDRPRQLMENPRAIDELQASLELVRADQEEYRLNAQSVKSQLAAILEENRALGEGLQVLQAKIDKLLERGIK